MNAYTFHITFSGLVSLGAIFIGLTFAVLLWSTKRANQPANRFLSLALCTIVLTVAWQLAIDTGLDVLFPHWGWLPLQCSLALGPLIYFYVLKLTQPEYKIRWRDMWHFVPLLLQQCTLLLEITESRVTAKATYNTLVFQQVNPVINILAFVSVIVYLYCSFKLIDSFYRQIKFNDVSDRYRYRLQWLHRRLIVFGSIWLLWLPCTAIDYFYYHHQAGSHIYYSWYILLSVAMIRISALTLLRPDAVVSGQESPALKSTIPFALKQKGTWLKKAMETQKFYLDAELSLSSLAEKLSITPHELSRIINTVFKKKFTDFVNAYRVAEVARRMHDPAYNHITLLGIAFESGFNSKTTFNRAFKQFTGKDPSDYKNELKKEGSSYKMGRYPRFAAAISYQQTKPKWFDQKFNRIYMLRNYFKIAWRNLINNKVLSLINVGGLAVGMAVVMLISLWVLDEVSFNKCHGNYGSIARVIQNVTNNGEVKTSFYVPYPLAADLRKNYGSYFKSLAISTPPRDYVVTFADKKLTEQGSFMEAGGPALFTLQMLKGRGEAIKDPSSILISAATAKAFFGNEDAMGKVLKLKLRWNGLDNLKIAGIYADLPENSTLAGIAFIGSWAHYEPGLSGMKDPWGNGSFNLYVQLADNVDPGEVTLKIKNESVRHLKPDAASAKPALFLLPMRKWHLYSEFKDGKSIGGKIRYVWLFGIAGVFVLLLACINFMNLSTARSEKRAREVGIRKAIGSSRSQLIYQFYGESLLCVSLAFLAALLMARLSIPAFNQLAGKQIVIPWNSLAFWLTCIGLSLATGIIAGSYPALYLSSFKTVKALKGAFRVGRLAAVPRKVLLVVQFTVSIVLIIGTIVVIRQIIFAKDRSVGYSQDRLIAIPIRTFELHQHFDAIKHALTSNGTITEMAEADSKPNKVPGTTGGIAWPGKDPNLRADFGQENISYDYGKTIGWELNAGRDFSRSFLSDSSAVIINQAAADFMTMKKPTENRITFYGQQFKVIGVTKDIINRSPYEQVQPMVYFLAKGAGGCLLLKINPKMGAGKAINNIASVLKKENPEQPFEYYFVDQDYAKEFGDEERIGMLATVFAGLAILISCLGLFGMAMFMAEQRVKEIGVRKVLGASVFALWQLLSKDFVFLVFISIIIASPIAYYLMHNWLHNYQYHINVAWWIFIVTAIGAILITLITVSFQTVKAALANPVKSLRSE